MAAGLFLWGMDANADKDRAKAAAADAQARLQARSAGPKTYDYVIYAGEDEPGEYSTFDSDWAYPRVAPDVSALGVTENRIEVGTHVRVICQLEIGGLRWFQLESRDFVHGAVARAAPHSGESEAPNCPDAPE